MKIHNKPPITIMVVDDDADLLHIITIQLKEEGFETLTSLNGENIWEIISQTRPDLILLDLNMRGINGADICKQLKSDPATHPIPVIIFSANVNAKMIQQECGADALIPKPMTDNIIIETINQYLPCASGI